MSRMNNVVRWTDKVDGDKYIVTDLMLEMFLDRAD